MIILQNQQIELLLTALAFFPLNPKSIFHTDMAQDSRGSQTTGADGFSAPLGKCR
jgi:hypothetical protein